MPSVADATVRVDGIKRSVFFFPSGSDQLYGSMYEAEEPSLPAVVLCPAWGGHLARSLQFGHEAAAVIARAGGVVLLYHPPGEGDSLGDAPALTPGRLAEAAADAAGALRARTGGRPVVLGGVRLGALVAAEAAGAAGVAGVLFLQPLLDPRVAADQLSALGAERAWPSRGAAVLEGVAAPQASVHLARPGPGPLPPAMRAFEVEGDWRRPEHRARLYAAAVRWLAEVPAA